MSAKVQQQSGQRQRAQQIWHGAQQQRIQFQVAHPGLEVALTGVRKTIRKAPLLIEQLHHPHALNRLTYRRIDLAKDATRTMVARRTQALITQHHINHHRNDAHTNQHQAPIKNCHGDKNSHNQGNVLHKRRHHMQEQILDRFGVVGNARNQLAGWAMIKITQGLAHHGAKHLGANGAHYRKCHLIQAHRLQVTRPGRNAIKDHINSCQHPQITNGVIILGDVIIQKHLDHHRPQDLPQRRQYQKHPSLLEQPGVGQGITQQPQ